MADVRVFKQKYKITNIQKCNGVVFCIFVVFVCVFIADKGAVLATALFLFKKSQSSCPTKLIAMTNDRYSNVLITYMTRSDTT